MKEHALTTHNGQAALVAAPKTYLTIEGMEDLTLQEDLILPRWRLVQDSSKISDNVGWFHNNITEEVRETLDLVVLKITPSRAYFNKLRELVCMSANASFSTDGKECLGCPNAQWGDDGEPSVCKRGYTFVCLDRADDTLCLVGALSKAATPAKKYISWLHLKKLPPFAYATQFSSVFTAYAKGDFFLLQVDVMGLQDEEDQALARDQYRALANVTISEAAEPAYEGHSNGKHEDEPLPF